VPASPLPAPPLPAPSAARAARPASPPPAHRTSETAPAARPLPRAGAPLAAGDVVRLQRAAGNGAVARMLTRAAPAVQRMRVGGLEVTTLAEVAEQTENQGWAFADGLDEEIATRLLATATEYDTIEQFENEVRLRKELIAGMQRIHEGGVNIDYNHAGDNLTLPLDEWQAMAAYDEEGEPAAAANEAGAAAFRSRNTPAAAVDAIFADKDEHYFLECNTATVAIHYRALRQVLGTDAFNQMFADGLTLMPEWLTTGPEDGDAPSLELIPEAAEAPATLENLVPGDWVYFVNYPDYAVRHPNGAFTGENALYLGGGRFRGFGVDVMTHDDMNEYLRARYNDGLPAAQRKGDREASEETLDNLVPGITRANIRRVGDNPDVRGALDF
jgi:hypothetical protein